MTIEQANNEIIKISNNPGLTSDAKKARIKVYQTYIMNTNSEIELYDAMKEYVNSVEPFIRLTNGLYQIIPCIRDNELFLRGYILESNVCKELEKRGITKYTHTDLKLTYIPDYEARHHTNLADVAIAIELYNYILKIIRMKDNQITTIAHYLAEIIDPKLIYKEISEKYIKYGQVETKRIVKTPERLMQDFQKAIIYINELQLHNGILDSATKDLTIELIKTLFNYYRDNDFKFPSVLLEQSNNEENKIS